MVEIEKEYTFSGTGGQRSLLDLFDGHRQLIVYHFMFDPAWEKGCPGCTGFVDGLSVFLRDDDRVFHTDSAYARGVEGLTSLYGLVDVTPNGRQQDFEDSPPGWPQKPTYG